MAIPIAVMLQKSVRELKMDNFEIRFGGTGGQGLQLSAKLLADALSAQGLNVAPLTKL